jgi:hypothetical protein
MDEMRSKEILLVTDVERVLAQVSVVIEERINHIENEARRLLAAKGIETGLRWAIRAEADGAKDALAWALQAFDQGRREINQLAD